MIDMSREAVSERLREASRHSDLDLEKRLDAKIPMDSASVSARLREASELLALCEKLRLGRAREPQR